MFNKLIQSLMLIAFLFLPSLWASDSVHNKEGKADVAKSIYALDGDHSKLGFKVSHLGISTVSGYFKNFSGELTFEGDVPVAATATVQVPSVFTENAKRDKHLRSDDFFGAETFPLIQFESHDIKLDGKKITVTGDLTIRDVTKSITLTGDFGGVVFVDMWKVHKTGMSLKGVINRQDFGLKFNAMFGTGEAVVGDEVELQIDLEANKQ